MRGLASLAMLSAALLLATPLLSACGESAPEKKAEAASTPAQTPVMPEDAPPQEEAEATITDPVPPTPVKSCAEDIGPAASAKLVQRCIAVSPATHPPCNAQNECALIQGEIDRSCAMYGPNETKPAECAA
jgi:hypothetical protein